MISPLPFTQNFDARVLIYMRALLFICAPFTNLRALLFISAKPTVLHCTEKPDKLVLTMNHGYNSNILQTLDTVKIQVMKNMNAFLTDHRLNVL